MKNYERWHKKKKQINNLKTNKIYFHEREIWWCHLGLNIGYEQDGKGSEYWRPIIIVKKYNTKFFTGIPMTTISKGLPFYFKVGKVDGKNASAILSQARSLSANRLVNRIGMMDKSVFLDMKKAASAYIFGD